MEGLYRAECEVLRAVRSFQLSTFNHAVWRRELRVLSWRLVAPSITIVAYVLTFHGAEGVGGDCSAHLSTARVRPAGYTFYATGRQGKRRGARGHEIETPLRGGARASYLCAGVLRRSRAAGTGAAGFL